MGIGYLLSVYKRGPEIYSVCGGGTIFLSPVYILLRPTSIYDCANTYHYVYPNCKITCMSFTALYMLHVVDYKTMHYDCKTMHDDCIKQCMTTTKQCTHILSPVSQVQFCFRFRSAWNSGYQDLVPISYFSYMHDM